MEIKEIENLKSLLSFYKESLKKAEVDLEIFVKSGETCLCFDDYEKLCRLGAGICYTTTFCELLSKCKKI